MLRAPRSMLPAPCSPLHARIILFNPESGETPHALIGVDLEGEAQPILGEAGMLARGVQPPGEIVDFIQVNSGERGACEY